MGGFNRNFRLSVMKKIDIENIIDLHGGHFSYDELRGIATKGSPENLNLGFLCSYLDWRGWHGFSTMVLSAYRPGSDKDDAHNGFAIDSVLWKSWKKEVVHPKTQWLLATTWPFQGVGIYFDWGYNGKPVVGLHCDTLENKRRPVRWLRITREVNGEETKLYYYQSTKDGSFFNKKVQEKITLDDAIKNYWKR